MPRTVNKYSGTMVGHSKVTLSMTGGAGIAEPFGPQDTGRIHANAKGVLENIHG